MIHRVIGLRRFLDFALMSLAVITLTPIAECQVRLGLFDEVTAGRAIFADPQPDDELLPININQAWGLMNGEGKIIAYPSFDWVDRGQDGLARAVAQGRTGFIRGNGRWAIDPQFEFVDRFSEGYAIYGVNGRFGFLDRRGRALTEPIYDSALRMKAGYAAVRIAGRCGFLDQRMRFAIEPSFAGVRSFCDGLAAVRFFPGDPRGLAGLIDKRGRVLFSDPSKQIIQFGDLSDGLIRCETAEGWGFIDQRFRPVIKPMYEDARDFVNGLAAVKLQGKWGYIDKKGRLLVEPIYDEADDFDDILAMVRLGVLWATSARPAGWSSSRSLR